MIPYSRNPFVTGREKVLSQLKATLRFESANDRVALYGLGGVGKTEVAIEYVYSNIEYYSAIFWINAANQATLFSSFREIATTTGCIALTTGLNSNDLSTALKAWFEKEKNWLLIVDKLDDISIIRKQSGKATDITQSHLPDPHGQGHILFTTRNRYTDEIPAIGVEVECLEIQPAIQYLRTRSKSGGYGAYTSHRVELEAEKIVKEVGCLPLAIEQVAAYIREVCKDIFKFLPRYEENPSEIHRRIPSGDWTYSESLATTWLSSFRAVRNRNSTVPKLLQLFAFLNPDLITKDFLRRGLNGLDRELQRLVRCDDCFENSLVMLEEFSLIRRPKNRDEISIHKLVQKVLRDELMATNTRTKSIWRAVQSVVGLRLEESLDVRWKKVVNFFLTAFPAEVTNSDREACRQMQQQLITPLLTIPEFEWESLIEILLRVGSFLRDEGKYAESEALLEKAKSICIKREGERSLKTLIVIGYLAATYRHHGRWDEALSLQEMVLNETRTTLGEGHRETLNAMNSLALTFFNQGRLDEARHLQEAVLKGREALLGDRHPRTLNAMNNLALTVCTQERWDDAVALQETALKVMKEVLGDRHPRTLIMMDNLGWTYNKLERLDDAARVQETALSGMKAVCGEMHPDTLTVMDNLGSTYWKQGRHEEAVGLKTTAVEGIKPVYGEEHPTTMALTANLEEMRREVAVSELRLW